MAVDDTMPQRILDSYQKGICPRCENPIRASGGVGTGRIEEGLFCSLDCYSRFYGRELEERASSSPGPDGSE